LKRDGSVELKQSMNAILDLGFHPPQEGIGIKSNGLCNDRLRMSEIRHESK
jgi:hypothetical protein